MSHSGAWATIIGQIEKCLAKTPCGFHMRLPINDLYGFIYDITGIISPGSGMEDSWRIKFINEKNMPAVATIGQGSSNRFEVVPRSYRFPSSFPAVQVFETAMSMFSPRVSVASEGRYTPGPAVRVEQPYVKAAPVAAVSSSENHYKALKAYYGANEPPALPFSSTGNLDAIMSKYQSGEKSGQSVGTAQLAQGYYYGFTDEKGKFINDRPLLYLAGIHENPPYPNADSCWFIEGRFNDSIDEKIKVDLRQVKGGIIFLAEERDLQERLRTAIDNAAQSLRSRGFNGSPFRLEPLKRKGGARRSTIKSMRRSNVRRKTRK